jgi:hypothetical protein
VTWREFPRLREGLQCALDGGLWLHRFSLNGIPMAHLISADRDALLTWGSAAGIDARWLQYKPLRDPRTGARTPAWHWDLWGERLPPRRTEFSEGDRDQGGSV